MADLIYFEFVWWWILLLLPLPLLVYYFVPPLEEKTAITLPYLPSDTRHQAPANMAEKGLTLLLWLFLLLACARPVWYGEPVEMQPKHRDLMLVVDLSGSMETRDMASEDGHIDRLSAVKNVLTEFIAKRKGDRLGLVFFANHAYLQTPLTLDRATISQQLNRSVLNLIGSKTAIGEGIGLATKTFIDRDAQQRVIVLLSDGSNTSGVIEPITAAEIAQKYHTTIYTIGIGAGEMEIDGFFGSRTVNTAKDLDETTLARIAELTGGQYFRARNQQELQQIYDEIDRLEPISGATQTWRPQSEWFPYPLGLALTCSVLLAIMRRRRG